MRLANMYGRLNFFEKMLFLAGIAVTIIGFYYINKLYTGEGNLSWALVQSAFLWLLLIFLIILTDSNESIKEELKIEIIEHRKETAELKAVAQAQLKVLEKMAGKRASPKKASSKKSKKKSKR